MKKFDIKKLGVYTILLAMGSATFVGCSSSKKSTKDGGLGGDTSIATTAVKTVATIVGAILLAKLLKSVLNTVGGSSIFGSTAKQPSFMENFNENTKLNSFANNDLMKSALQALVATHYKIPIATVAKNYGSFVTAGDLATFIGKNADAKVLREIK